MSTDVKASTHKGLDGSLCLKCFIVIRSIKPFVGGWLVSKVIENLDKLTELNVFCIGQNLIENMENTMYLRKFHNLRLVNLAGNPFTKDPEYFSYVLSHINNLKYLDYRLVDKNSVITARDVYQDELLELEQKEELITQERKKAKEDASHAELMAEANMTVQKLPVSIMISTIIIK
jgi:Leucine-rich repeat (LRR) protein